MIEGLIRISQVAKERPDEQIQNLAQLINIEMLRECRQEMDGGKAVGIDGMTKDAYGHNLEENLASLLDRMRRGAYEPLPIKRIYIPKDFSAKMRPLGLSVYEDKLVQKAVAKILTVIYEPVFLAGVSHFIRNDSSQIRYNQPF